MDIAGDSGRLIVRLMSASSRRAEVIASNIANQNTPGFKRSTVVFEDLLSAELEKGDSADLLSIAPREFVDEITPEKGNGNNVHMELETNAMSQNRLLYETYSTILAGRMELMRAAIQEG